MEQESDQVQVCVGGVIVILYRCGWSDKVIRYQSSWSGTVIRYRSGWDDVKIWMK